MPNTVTDQCDKDCWSYLAVMRVSFSLVIYHSFFALVVFGVRNTMDWRASLQNGFWAMKFVLWIGLLVGTFYMPDTLFYNYWYVV
jgi:hypothetical protein